uniref:Vps16 N-terminal domain-containing protein n=1 Tax=Glossina brevipalpis TaxID=37001 RepID=A0A1A9WT63_9MUSC
MGSVDIKQKYCEFDTDQKDVAKQIEWIMNAYKTGLDAVSFRLTIIMCTSCEIKEQKENSKAQAIKFEFQVIKIMMLNIYKATST